MTEVSAVEWVSVESDVFSAASYRRGARQLYLRFTDGNIYCYFDCPASVYKEFLAAESKGRYFAQHIRNRFRDELVYRNAGGSPQESLEQQLRSSVALAKSRAAQKRDDVHAAGVHE